MCRHSRVRSCITIVDYVRLVSRSSHGLHLTLLGFYSPGARIRTASTANQTRYGLFSGTSAAAPHVTGVIARYLERDPTMNPDQIRQKLMDDAINGRLMRIFQLFSPNKLLHINREA
jgi:subtilisin family serine protease